MIYFNLRDGVVPPPGVVEGVCVVVVVGEPEVENMKTKYIAHHIRHFLFQSRNKPWQCSSTDKYKKYYTKY